MKSVKKRYVKLKIVPYLKHDVIFLLLLGFAGHFEHSVLPTADRQCGPSLCVAPLTAEQGQKRARAQLNLHRSQHS